MSDHLDEPYASALDDLADHLRDQAEYAPDPRDAYPDAQEIAEIEEDARRHDARHRGRTW